MSEEIDITVLPIEDTVMELDPLDDIDTIIDVAIVAPVASNPSWTDISNKPFATLDNTTLKVESGVLKVNSTDYAEQDNAKPITSAGVHTIVGNIEILLETI